MTRARRSAARLAAPAAFLLAVTVAVLLVRSGLSGDTAVPRVATVLQTTSATLPPSRGATGSRAGARFYEVQEGDTLDGVAAQHETTVEQLLVLNPDVDPVALRIGQRLRVK